jgi:aminopeptidase YwaD
VKNAFLLLACVVALPLHAQTNPADITAAELREHVRYLSSDELQGRGSGTDGNREAAIYIAAKLKTWGLHPAGVNNTFFQPFDFVSSVKLGETNTVELEGPAGDRALKVDTDFRPYGFSSTAAVDGPLVFVGYGVTAPEKQYDDYAGIDVKGKVVVMFRYGPDGASPRSEYQRHTGLRNKARVARDKGAIAMIMINGPADEAEDGLYKLALDQGAGSSGIVSVSMKRDILEPYFRAAGWSLKALQDSMRAHLAPKSFDLAKCTAALNVTVNRITSQSANIVAYLEGNDPKLKDQVIVLGAHMDHLGMGGPGSGSMVPDTIAIHNGADDNASGTASLMELAQAISAHAGTIRRSYVFTFFSGEELGTLGSQAYVSMPFYPLNQTIAMLNMDMVGRLQNKALSIGGTGTSGVWPSLISRHNADSTFSITMNPDGFGPSDHASFYGKDVPVLFFFTGTHDDYHKPSDDWEKINFAGQEKITNLVSAIVTDLDTMAVRPPFVRVQMASAGRGGSQSGDSRSFTVTLGIVPDVGESSTGMKVSGVRPNGAGEKAGLQAGDILVGMAGKKIMNIYDYMGLLGELKAGDEVVLDVIREGKTIQLKAVMQKRN